VFLAQPCNQLQLLQAEHLRRQGGEEHEGAGAAAKAGVGAVARKVSAAGTGMGSMVLHYR
jgi:hypothetical protein